MLHNEMDCSWFSLTNLLCFLGHPEFTTNTSIVQVERNDSFNYTVTVVNVLPNRSYWLHNNLNLSRVIQFNESTRFNVQLCQATFMLQLNNLQLKHTGTYSLHSTNSAGSNYVGFTLCVVTGKFITERNTILNTYDLLR